MERDTDLEYLRGRIEELELELHRLKVLMRGMIADLIECIPGFKKARWMQINAHREI